jgi:hypothetical protein
MHAGPETERQRLVAITDANGTAAATGCAAMRTRTLAKPDRARRAAALALPIAVGLLALGAAPALAAPSWSSPVDLIPFAANAYQVNPRAQKIGSDYRRERRRVRRGSPRGRDAETASNG